MKALLDQNGRDRRPHDVAPNCWYYEEPGGLAVYFRYPGKSDVALVGVIPWRSIRASLKRNDKRPNKRIQTTAPAGLKSKRTSKNRGG